MGPVKRFHGIEWHTVAGVVAAVLALVLHLLHVVDQEVVFAVVLVLLALILLGGLRAEGRGERLEDRIAHLEDETVQLRSLLPASDTILIGPQQLRAESQRFARAARGEMVWFNVCLLMFVPQDLFDALLRPAVENVDVSRIRFVLDERERTRWETEVRPKIDGCAGAPKVAEPTWTQLEENVSFILAEQAHGGIEGHLSFWGEPFMSRSAGRDIPRYIFRVLEGSELIARLSELERSYR
jgi:hypothetical protein